MFEVELSWAEVEMAAHVGARRQIDSLRRGLPDKHGYEGSGWDNHVEGAMGEITVAKALGRYWNGSIGTFKSGGDVGKIQVRCRSKLDYDLIIRTDDRDADWFVLVLGRCPRYWVVGYISGAEAKQEQWLQNHGGRPPAYFVPQSALTPFKVEAHVAAHG